VVEATLDRPQNSIGNEAGVAVDQVRALAEALLEVLLVAFRDGDAIGDDEHAPL
jgi:hypothetical protein